MEPSGVMMRSLLLDEEEEEASPSGASSSVDRRRVEEEVGRTRVAVVVVRRSGMSSRPMLPEAEVMRIVVGGMFPCWCVVLCCVMVFLFCFCFCFCSFLLLYSLDVGSGWINWVGISVVGIVVVVVL